MFRCFDVLEFRDCVKKEGAVYLNHTCITSGDSAWDEVAAECCDAVGAVATRADLVAGHRQVTRSTQ